MRLRLLTAAVMMGLAPVAASNTLDAYLSKDTAQFTFITDSAAIGFGGADLSFGVFFNDDSDYMLTTGLNVVGVPAGEQPLTFGVGGKAYLGFIDTPDDRFQSVALGGEVRYTIPANMPMYLAAEAYYGPRVTTFGDARDLLDASVRYELEVTPGARGFIGYRYLEADMDRRRDYKMDEHVHFGVRFNF
ncbi:MULTISPECIES: YfaZ family outer membrane protein [Ectothiorhodospira]|uniref:YfaZ family outer membrane protein n=1 Tax=Ectothiorhodospira TaxID=1051 RepID=UPI001EE8BAF6|nr:MULTISPECIES: YfaZ family outer membrane protein [Ectothiorhodospira]MCG5493303.1 YfaZ family protein [Ectothiorhodospira variabilis]MCG5502632.1 YfaZ family protein [Ectothiorhodospira variabilis]MCG5505602.1 YfaZ family protein [Ectothiorhodospira variabilis]MCG5523362.1 YfaZ family protein [Ectothiorhodospira haloalkaliphila]